MSAPEQDCAPANCVAGCGAKAECDPGGYGAAYVNFTVCPLNVCCSKWGYCGTTEEFCGDKTVTRPSCGSDTNSVTRVLGYYEGWAARRVCQAFVPENIPIGVYSHLNFAFASIDPNTFEVVPADDGDIDLYSRLTALKKLDSSLKVFIAIGGWDFNNPGPTATTFSDLAASTANQQRFFASLISFMSTYNFDGVDIDWEYPAADDRSGRPEDLTNFPVFISNLKLALASSSGGRDGLTITLPVSYWYLQNFDIVKLEPWVDWFNVMSYDLHGLWDKGNKWLGPFLNSHTNLTEITEYLDLLWRNSINPAKVNLGLAFYSRTFIASDPGCLAPGCTFVAVGDPGPCTNSLGTLSNAELTDMIENAGAMSSLSQDAAVEIATVGLEWITYDDAASWKLKLDFARGECLGGVMVWAVSQDYTDGTYSKQLQTVTQYMSPSVTEYELTDGSTVTAPDVLVVRNQCLWTNCGVGCPSGYTTVPRKDTDGMAGEIMEDGTRCRGGQLRIFCCPSALTIPNCGWFDFNNGNCGAQYNSVCPAGSQDIIGPYSSEVASLSMACHSGLSQVACCESGSSPGDLSSDMGYAMCVWDGTPPSCGDVSGDPNIPVSYICNRDAPMNFFLFDSPSGSGAESCYTDSGQRVNRAYCCNPPTDSAQWQACNWLAPRKSDDGWCEAYCPDGTVRLAMEDPLAYDFCQGPLGGRAMCCTPRFLTEAENAGELQQAYVSALEDVATNPCTWSTISDLSLRTAVPELGVHATPTPEPTPVHRNTRRSGQGSHDYNCQLAFADTYNMLGSNDANQVQSLQGGWDQAMQDMNYNNLPASRIANEPSGVAFGGMERSLQTIWVETLLNIIPELDETDEDEEEVPACPVWWSADPAIGIDVDDGGVDNCDPYTRKAKRSLVDGLEPLKPRFALDASGGSGSRQEGLARRVLDERDQTGAERQFWVVSTAPMWTPQDILSLPYPNGNQGDDLLALNQNNNRYMMVSRGCGPQNYTLVTNAVKSQLPSSNIWVCKWQQH